MLNIREYSSFFMKRTFDIPKMWGVGTPEDLKYFEENYKNN